MQSKLISAIEQYEAAVSEVNANWDGELPAEEHIPPDVVARYQEAESALALALPGTDVLGWHNGVRHGGKVYARVGGGRVAAIPMDLVSDAADVPHITN